MDDLQFTDMQLQLQKAAEEARRWSLPESVDVAAIGSLVSRGGRQTAHKLEESLVQHVQMQKGDDGDFPAKFGEMLRMSDKLNLNNVHNGATVWMAAAAKNRVDVLNFFGVAERTGQLSERLDLSVVNDEGKQALEIAVESDAVDAAKWLMSRGANMRVETEEGITLLHVAAARGNAKMIFALLDHPSGALDGWVDAVDRFGRGSTPLMWGLEEARAPGDEKKAVEASMALLERGADASRVDGRGTPTLWYVLRFAPNKKLVAEVVDVLGNDILERMPNEEASGAGAWVEVPANIKWEMRQDAELNTEERQLAVQYVERRIEFVKSRALPARPVAEKKPVAAGAWKRAAKKDSAIRRVQRAGVE